MDRGEGNTDVDGATPTGVAARQPDVPASLSHGSTARAPAPLSDGPPTDGALTDAPSISAPSPTPPHPNRPSPNRPLPSRPLPSRQWPEAGASNPEATGASRETGTAHPARPDERARLARARSIRILLATLLLAACVAGFGTLATRLSSQGLADAQTGGAEPAASDAASATGLAQPAAAARVLRWISGSAPGNPDPHTVSPDRVADAATVAVRQIYDSLIRVGEDGTLEPGLALRWEALTPERWQLSLRPGVRFHDGNAFLADDVVFSLRRARLAGSVFAGRVAPLQSVIAVDDTTLEVITFAPVPDLPRRLADIPILSRVWARESDSLGIRTGGPFSVGGFSGMPAAPQPNGTGAYRFGAEDSVGGLVLERHGGWWGWRSGQTGPDRIILHVDADDLARVGAMVRGEADVLLDAPARSLARLSRERDLDIHAGVLGPTVYLGLRQIPARGGASPFADRRVRDAIHRAVNRRALARVVLRGAGEATTSLRLDAPTDQSAYDLAAARSLLADAGFADGFDVTLDCPQGPDPQVVEVCRAVATMLARLQVRVGVEVRSPDAHRARIADGRSVFYLDMWDGGDHAGAAALTALFGSSSPRNGTGYAEQTNDMLIATLSQERDLDRRQALLRQAWDMADDARVYVPLYHATTLWVTARHVRAVMPADRVPRFAHWVLD